MKRLLTVRTVTVLAASVGVAALATPRRLDSSRLALCKSSSSFDSTSKKYRDTKHQTYEARGTYRDFSRHYRIRQGVLGCGTFAEVKKGSFIPTGEDVAVKEINKEFSDEEALRNEVQVMERMGTHANLANLRNVYEGTNLLYVVMDLAVNGELFDRVLSNNEISEREASKMFRDALRGVFHLHRAGICHLDIKPENLLLMADDRVAIADFGLARQVEEDEKLDVCCGTPAYWSPEMVKNEPFGVAVDMWALGCVLYIMLLGVHPFDPDGDAPETEILARVAVGDYDTTCDGFDDLSVECKDIIAKLLEVDPAKRVSAEEVLRHPWVANLSRVPREPLPPSHIRRLRGFKLLRLLKAGLEEQFERAEENIFERFDADGDGFLTHVELQRAIESLGLLDGNNTKSQDYLDLFSVLDLDNDGRVSKKEMEALLTLQVLDTPMKSTASPRHDVREASERLYDAYKDPQRGEVSFAKLRHLGDMLELARSDAELRALSGVDGEWVTEEQFSNLLVNFNEEKKNAARTQGLKSPKSRLHVPRAKTRVAASP